MKRRPPVQLVASCFRGGRTLLDLLHEKQGVLISVSFARDSRQRHRGQPLRPFLHTFSIRAWKQFTRPFQFQKRLYELLV